MKAIFLDIDGVICLKPPKTLDEGTLKCLKRIVDTTGAVIILSSTWRVYPEYKQIVVDALTKLGLTLYGVTVDRPFGPRHTEIQEFLDDNPTIEKFAIIDDQMDAEIMGKPGTFFLTDYPDGLTAAIADRIIIHLNS